MSKLLLIAHRGYSGNAPENTFAAFDLAIARGWHHIEFDVQLSRDGIPVIMHDTVLERTTNTYGPLADRTLNELRTLDAGSWFDSRFKGEQIPTLEEMLQRYRSAHLHIELKSQEPELPEVVAALLATRPSGPQLVISSEWTEQLERIRPLVVEQADYEQISHTEGDKDFTWAAQFGARSFHLHGKGINPELTQEAWSLGLDLGAWWWTPEEQDVRHLRIAGARYAFVDAPGLHAIA